MMVEREGKFGKFLACSNYPTCSNMRSENIELSEEICEKCGDNGLMLIRVIIENLSRTAISGGKRPNPSDLGS